MIYKTESVEDIMTVLSHPEIWERVREDGIDDFTPPIDENHIYLIDRPITGLFIAHWINAITMECHVQVLPEHRKGAHEFGKKVIQWIRDNTHCKKLVAQIPFIYPDVAKFAESKGFLYEGINRHSYLKNGLIYDQYYMGLAWDS